LLPAQSPALVRWSCVHLLLLLLQLLLQLLLLSQHVA
jgi:hypothetical protein